jgi:hypothetical protein
MRLYRRDAQGAFHNIATPGSLSEMLISLHRLPRQLLRLGIHHAWPLKNQGTLAVIKKRAITLDSSGRQVSLYSIRRGNKPGHKGVCTTPDGTVFLAEYALNNDRSMPISLYRSLDNANSFHEIKEFPAGDIRHLHFVQYDPFSGWLWLGSGDTDKESRIYTSRDSGESWELIGEGSQKWRAICVSFTEDAVYWGTDAGSDAGTHPNWILRWDRKQASAEVVQELQGPCHGSASLCDGFLLVSTGVEGGVNEKDRNAHLWASKDGMHWEEVFSRTKDSLPFILQFGVMRFPPGLEAGNEIAFTCMGLKGEGEVTYFGKLTEE